MHQTINRQWWSILIGLLSVGCLTDGCTPPPFTFTFSENYLRDQFSGREIGSHSVGICPLLISGNAVPDSHLSSSAVTSVILKKRPDLLIVGTDSVRAGLASRLLPESLEYFYRILFLGEIVALQTADSLWRAVGTDFLLTLRLRQGMDIRTFNQVTRKKIRLEAELWDCIAMETVWRTVVLGTCIRDGISDQEFFIAAIGSVVSALPRPAPSYETRSW